VLNSLPREEKNFRAISHNAHVSDKSRRELESNEAAKRGEEPGLCKLVKERGEEEQQEPAQSGPYSSELISSFRG
jgi:hypothetical protein